LIKKVLNVSYHTAEWTLTVVAPSVHKCSPAKNDGMAQVCVIL